MYSTHRKFLMILHTSGIVCSKGAGGFAGIIFHNGKTLRMTVGQGKNVTKSQMELYGVLEGLKLALINLQPNDIIQLFTDSKFVSEEYLKIPAYRRNMYAGTKSPMIVRELHEVMKLAGDKLFVDHESLGEEDLVNHIHKAAEIARRLELSDYAYNPDTPENIIRGVQLK